MAGRIEAECHAQPAIAQIADAVADQRQGCRRLGRRKRVQRQTRVAGSTLAVLPVEIEAPGRHAVERGRIARVEIGHAAPNIGRRRPVIDEERVRAGPAHQEIRARIAVQHVVPIHAAHIDRVIAAASLDEYIRHQGRDVQIFAGEG